jgi:hypothetical protein
LQPPLLQAVKIAVAVPAALKVTVTFEFLDELGVGEHPIKFQFRLSTVPVDKSEKFTDSPSKIVVELIENLANGGGSTLSSSLVQATKKIIKNVERLRDSNDFFIEHQFSIIKKRNNFLKPTFHAAASAFVIAVENFCFAISQNFFCNPYYKPY